MAQLIVRNLDDEVKQRLAERARRHGRSMEQEVRDILREAVSDRPAEEPEVDMGTRLTAFFAEHRLTGYDIEELKGEEARAATFE
jgi:plasmid stability protein